jgi:hypothetical protein
MDLVDSSPSAMRPSPDIVVRRLGQGGVLVHLSSNRVFELNETGIRIWELLNEGLDRTAILDRLQQEFSVDAPEAARELDAFVHDLRQEHFLLA